MNDSLAAVSERQQTQPSGQVGVPLFGPEQQQHITGMQRQLANVVAETPPLPRHADKRDAIAVQQLHRHCGTAGQFRRFLHDHFAQHEVVAFEETLALADVFEFHRTDRLFQAVRARFDDQDVPGFDLRDTRQPRQAAPLARQADDLHINLVREVVEITYALADDVGTFGHPRFRDVIGKIEEILALLRCVPVRRQQAPADQCYVSYADGGADDANRGKIEHPVWRTQRIAAKFCNDYVRRRANQGDHPAEDRGEGQRHE